MKKVHKHLLCLSVCLLGINACSFSSRTVPVTEVAQKKVAMKMIQNGSYKIGKPYQIFGKWYKPKEYRKYKKVGIASWYGPKFHNKLTANGETFDQYAISAAHPTLPLPSVVKVTNLENGKSIILRVNDRGPFAKNREIDLSKKAAEYLGFINQGTTKVEVELLVDESRVLKEKMMKGEKTFFASEIKKNVEIKKEFQKHSHTKHKTKETLHLQFAAFAQKENAMALRNQISPHSHGAFVLTVLENGKHIYKVLSGPLVSVDQVELTKQQMLNHGFHDMIIVSVQGAQS